MKKYIVIFSIAASLVACGGKASNEATSDSTSVDSTLVISDSSVVAPVANYRDSISVVK